MARKKILKVFSLGGHGEIGKNITVLECGEDIIIVDCGVAFPQNDMLGIDLVIPDFTYLIQNKERVRGVFLTHAHEDHIGSVPFLLRDVRAKLFGTRLTLGLVSNRLKEHGLFNQTEMYPTNPGQTVQAGCFKVEFVRVNHSIADAVAFSIETPLGVVVHSGDFKVDFTPIQGDIIDFQRLGQIGKKGVKLFVCESTNVLERGYTLSERTVGETFKRIFHESQDQRIIVAMFSSHIDRIQQVLTSAKANRRKVAFLGRSMINAVKTAVELGYLIADDGLIVDPGELKNYPSGDQTIVTTGSQGEPMAALSRMSASDHRQITINYNDKVIISATPIPGNEKMVSRVVNDLMKLGAEVIYEGMTEVHVSGHAKQEELKIMHALLKPQYFMPSHGEFRHLVHHRELAASMGMPRSNIFVAGIGEVLEITSNTARLVGTVPSGQMLVDGLGVGDVGNVVLRDRKHLSEDGLIIASVGVSMAGGYCHFVSRPEITTRGFVFVRESEELIEGAKAVVQAALDEMESNFTKDRNGVRVRIKEDLRNFIWRATKRNPMIFTILVEM